MAGNAYHSPACWFISTLHRLRGDQEDQFRFHGKPPAGVKTTCLAMSGQRMGENTGGPPRHARVGEMGQIVQNNQAGDQAGAAAGLKAGSAKQELQTWISQVVFLKGSGLPAPVLAPGKSLTGFRDAAGMWASITHRRRGLRGGALPASPASCRRVALATGTASSGSKCSRTISLSRPAAALERSSTRPPRFRIIVAARRAGAGNSIPPKPPPLGGGVSTASGCNGPAIER
jgi:hypothetical protein